MSLTPLDRWELHVLGCSQCMAVCERPLTGDSTDEMCREGVVSFALWLVAVDHVA